ncbi:hypothetical protein F8B91_00400 [Aestuariivirga litoralis]|nr:hypothetical protein [Aestuariivirga litoralis]
MLIGAQLHFLEGETLVSDLLDEWWLSRTSLQGLDRRWAANGSKSGVIISLTSTPSRAMQDTGLELSGWIVPDDLTDKHTTILTNLLMRARPSVRARRSNYQAKALRPFYSGNSLGRINRGPGGNEKRNNSVMLRYFSGRWLFELAPHG